MNKYKNGVVLEPQKLRNYEYEVCCGTKATTLPSSYIIPKENIPNVHDQGRTNSCVGFATAQCAESHLLNKENKNKHVSPFFTYGRNECRSGYDGKGMFVSAALKGLLNIGFLYEEYFDFFIDVPAILELANTRDDLLKISRQLKPTAYTGINYAVEDVKWERFKQALFESQEAMLIVSNSYRLFGGSHAIIAIGYADEYKGKKGRWVLIQNSWGKDYGDNGRDYINISDVDGIYKFVWEDIKLPFTDVKNTDWFFDDVKAMYLSGIINGIDNKTFAPYDNMIRGDVAIILSKLMERVEYSVNCFIRTCIQQGQEVKEISFIEPHDIIKFNDVNDGDYYADSIYYAVANGILKGIENNCFAPQKAITRAELSAVIVRVYEKIIEMLSESFDKQIKVPTQKIVLFNDVMGDKWYYQEVYNAYKYGFVQGDDTKNFRPEDNVTRAEASVIAQRLFKTVELILEQL